MLPSYPVLEASPAQPVEGHSVTLTCKSHLPAERQSVQFCFSSNNKFLGSGCGSSSKLQIPAIWTKWPEYYQCVAVATGLTTNRWSLPVRIHVQSECVQLALPELSQREQNRPSPTAEEGDIASCPDEVAREGFAEVCREAVGEGLWESLQQEKKYFFLFYYPGPCV